MVRFSDRIDMSFKYTPAAATNIRQTFARVRRKRKEAAERREAEKREDAAKVRQAGKSAP